MLPKNIQKTPCGAIIWQIVVKCIEIRGKTYYAR